MVPKHGAHDAGPRRPERQNALARALNLATVRIQQHRVHAKERQLRYIRVFECASARCYLHQHLKQHFK